MSAGLRTFFIRAFLLAGFAFAFVLGIHAVEVGDSQDAVRAAMGRPSMTRRLNDGAEIWKYTDGIALRFEGGVVREITEPSTRGPKDPRTPVIVQGSGRKNASASLTGAVNESGSISDPASVSPDTVADGMDRAALRKSASEAGTRNFGYIALGLGAFVGLACKIMLLVEAKRVSSGWMVICLFVPFGSVVFIFTHWEETKKLIATQLLVAVPLVSLGIYLTPR